MRTWSRCACSETSRPRIASQSSVFTCSTAFCTPLPKKRWASPSRSSIASREPVEAPEGTAARPIAPDSTSTSASTVGLPRESRISRARTSTMAVMRAFLLLGGGNPRFYGALDLRGEDLGEFFRLVEVTPDGLRRSDGDRDPGAALAEVHLPGLRAPDGLGVGEQERLRLELEPRFLEGVARLGFAASEAELRRGGDGLAILEAVVRADRDHPGMLRLGIQLRIHGFRRRLRSERLLRIGLREDRAGIEGLLGGRGRGSRRECRGAEHRTCDRVDGTHRSPPGLRWAC